MSKIRFESWLPSLRVRPIHELAFASLGRLRAYTEEEARAAIAASLSWSEALRRLGVRPAGGNHATLRKYADIWAISTEHFDPDAVRAAAPRREPKPLNEILVEGSTYSRSHLKERLYSAGLKPPISEMCGQGETWRGRRMALVLDHINGVGDDNRLENLRTLCPNCAATLDTHCGRKNLRPLRREIACLHCGAMFRPKYRRNRYCSRRCGQRSPRKRPPPPGPRRVERPPYDQLMRELAESNYSAVGRRYGVSDNVIRKWVRQYERDRAAADPWAQTAADAPGLAA